MEVFLKKMIIGCLSVFLLAFSSIAQETFPVNGVHNHNDIFYAFTNATIFVDYQTRIDNATLIIQKGRIVAIGEGVSIPNGSVVMDLKGKYIYPSLIDPYSSYGIPEKTVRPKKITNGAFHWNPAVHPETNAADLFAVNSKEAETLRAIGFGAVASHVKNGIVRGTSTVVTLGNGVANENILKPAATACFSFQKGISTERYPSSLMGSIALLRQVHWDADWYLSQNNPKEVNLSLEAMQLHRDLPHLMEANDCNTLLRAYELGKQIDRRFIVKGGGDEYKRSESIKRTQMGLILPLTFPQPYDVEDPYDAMMVSLEQMKHWEMAPANPFLIAQEGIPMAFTADGLKQVKMFWANVRKAIKHGLSEKEALKAMTYQPAIFLGVEDEIGSLRDGMVANFIITSGNLFAKETTIFQNWVNGKKYVLNEIDQIDVRGVYKLRVDSLSLDLSVKGKLTSPRGEILLNDSQKVRVAIQMEGRLISLTFELDEGIGRYQLSGKVNQGSGIWDGQAMNPEGEWVQWATVRREKFSHKTKKAEQKDSVQLGQITYPNGAYGWDALPEEEIVLFREATVWTNTDTGILERYDVLVRNGKIIQVDQYIEAPEGAKIVRARGKHLTSGIIDEHSHIAISRGVNEGSQAVTAEVSIEDVINADDINIYRQLAGGVTAAQLLHGSANPIGGRSALIKMRWGATAEEMKIVGADGFIKFALGENVKHSNVGRKSNRFPQTRMGVEQVYYDAFIRAKEYEQQLASGADGSVRRDEELEVLSEILNQTRFITCHSYVQSEINMLMHVGDSMGFRVNTFTHILEGYKVADKMKAHGVGASTFSDWWAYKFEVNDAIPYNAAILNEQGVVTAINSDDAEMGRRLNQEAAKVVKYGGVSEEDAWKMVTLNPAKLLHLDHRMGSVEPGKDADLVLWSENPLSVYAKVEKTFVDGICYYDAEKDLELRKRIIAERLRLIDKMIKAKKAGEKTQKPKPPKDKLYHCDSMEDEG